MLVPRQSPLLTAALGTITHRPSPLGSMRCHGRFVMRSPSSLGASERSPHLSCRSCAIGRTLLSLSRSLFLWPAAAPVLLLCSGGVWCRVWFRISVAVLTWLAGDAVSVLWSPCSACGLNNYTLLQFYPRRHLPLSCQERRSRLKAWMIVQCSRRRRRSP